MPRMRCWRTQGWRDTYPVPAAARLRLGSHPQFAVPAIAIFCCCACMGVPLIHLAGYVSAICGASSAGAAAMLAAMSACAVGRIASGLLADRIGNPRTYAMASVQQTA